MMLKIFNLDDGERIALMFRYGSIIGEWTITEASIQILSIKNLKPNNGDFAQFLIEFEKECIEHGSNLEVTNFENFTFRNHLLLKRGFKEIPNTDTIIKKLIQC